MSHTSELRPATDADVDTMVGLLEQTMREYVEATWGAWDKDRVRTEMSAFASLGQAWIVRHSAVDAGLLVIDRAETHIQIEQICIATSMQRQGLGTSLIRALVQEAGARRVPLCLRVLRVNPAHRLYSRLGFTVTRETPERLFMTVLPSPAGS